MVSIDDFKKLDLRVAKVISAEGVPGSEKLLRLVADIGGEERQILAGIAKYYTPENLVGRSIVVVANLEPRSLMGLESRGMLLAADSDRPIILMPEQDVPAGAKIK